MKIKQIAQATAIALAIGFSVPAAAIPVSTVGQLDVLIGSGSLGDSSLADENDFVQFLLESSLGSGYELTGKYDQLTEAMWEAVDGDADGFALDFGTVTCTEGVCSVQPEYYLIKVGIGNSPDGTPSHYLFENMASLQWAYVQLSQFAAVTDMNIGRVSHVSVGAGGGQVPEPASLALLGLGLLGVGAARRLSKKA